MHYLEDLSSREQGCQPLSGVIFGSSICLPPSSSRVGGGPVSGGEGASGFLPGQLAAHLAPPKGSGNVCKVASPEPDAAKAGGGGILS